MFMLEITNHEAGLIRGNLGIGDFMVGSQPSVVGASPVDGVLGVIGISD